MMKSIKKILFLTFMLAALSLSAYAQKSDDKKDKAPKKPPVTIEPDKGKKKEKPKDPPPSNDRNNFVPPKKPNGETTGLLGLITGI